MSGAPFRVTERLELWMPQADDMRPMFDIISQEETRRYLGPGITLEDHFMRFSRNAGSWHLYGYGMFMLRERGGDGSLIGNCGIFHSLRGLGEDFDDRPARRTADADLLSWQWRKLAIERDGDRVAGCRRIWRAGRGISRLFG